MTERLFLRLAYDPACGPETTVPATTLRAFSPGAALQEQLWPMLAYRENIAADDSIDERVLPDGALRLIFDFANTRNGPLARVAGASTAPVLLSLKGVQHGLSVALRPGAAAALLGLPAGELEGQVLPLRELWGASADVLMECLAGANNDASRAALLAAALQQRLPATPCLSAQRAGLVAREVVAADGGLSLRAAAAVAGIGERRLQQLFHEHVGLSFRAWSRLARLHGCMRRLRQRPPVGWAEIAIESGFYDQAHLANEFRSLCGLSPSLFLQRTVAQSSKTKS
jgi:AraC-like DNA-binding protein